VRTFTLPESSSLLSVIGLGTGIFGSEIGEEESFRILDAFAAAGGTLVDTAHVYASWLPGGEGQSERTLGRWLKKSGARMVVATKGGHPELASMTASRLSPDCLARDLDESLERLQLDSVDLYFLHRDDPAIPVGEILDALQAPLRQGRIRALGASNWSPARLQAAQREADVRGISGFRCSQCAWSLAEINPAMQGHLGMFCIEEKALQFHRETRFPLIAYSAQAQGFFAQSWSWPELPNPTAKQEALRPSYYSRKNVERWERAQELAARRQCSAGAIALAYVTSQDFPTAALIGPKSLAQVNLSLAEKDLTLSPDEVRFLEG
jgi:aryl-alcohol dehydrogenase-like predicted oxidoreductase